MTSANTSYVKCINDEFIEIILFFKRSIVINFFRCNYIFPLDNLQELYE